MVEDGLDVVFGSGSDLDGAVESRQDAVVAAGGSGGGIEIPVRWRRRRRIARRSAKDIVLGELNRRRGGGGLGLQHPEESVGRLVVAAEGCGAANLFHCSGCGIGGRAGGQYNYVPGREGGRNPLCQNSPLCSVRSVITG